MAQILGIWTHRAGLAKNFSHGSNPLILCFLSFLYIENKPPKVKVPFSPVNSVILVISLRAEFSQNFPKNGPSLNPSISEAHVVDQEEQHRGPEQGAHRLKDSMHLAESTVEGRLFDPTNKLYIYIYHRYIRTYIYIYDIYIYIYMIWYIYMGLRQNSGMDRPAVIQTYGTVWITCVLVWIGGMDRPVGSGCGSGLYILTHSHIYIYNVYTY